MNGSRRPSRAFMVPADFFESDEHDDLVRGLKAESANSAVVGWFRLQAAAKRRNGGTFASEAQLKQVLGHYARWIPRYRDIGILNDLTIRDWDLWQEDQDSDATRKLKERRQRDAERKAKKRAADRVAPGTRTGAWPTRSPTTGPADAPATRLAPDRPSETLTARMSADGPRTSARGDDGSGDETKVPSSQEKDEWADFGEDWAPFRQAWTARGFGHPPTPRQRAALWGESEAGGAVRDWPQACARWVAAAPTDARSYEVVAYVLSQYHEKRKDVAEPVTSVGQDPSRAEATTSLRRIGEIVAVASQPPSPAYDGPGS